MDTLFIGDIPLDYHYAYFSDGHIDLYNVPVLQGNRTYTYYRIYTYDNTFLYDIKSQTTTQYYSGQTNTDIPVSSSYVYRRDFIDICIACALFIGCGVWFFNLLTSSIRKGGLLGGLF